jgi:predicted TIM-barrel fold metal-dependent hydrolase
MIIDAHYHLEERLETVEELLTQMDQHGISRVTLIAPGVGLVDFKGIRGVAKLLPKLLMSPLPQIGMFFYNTTLTADNKFFVLGKRYAIYDVPDNESVAQVLETYPAKFYGWVFVNPRTVEPLGELEKWAGRPGWVGVKALPFWHRYTLSMLDDVAAWCEEKEWPMLVHLGNNRENGDYRYLPERHPGLKIIYAHSGVPFYREVWEYARGKENIFVDLSNPIYVDERARVGAVKALGAEQCVHGTDGPYACAEQGRMMERILQLPLSEREKACILGDNFEDLIGT